MVEVTVGGGQPLKQSANVSSIYHSDNPPNSTYPQSWWLAWDMDSDVVARVQRGITSVSVRVSAEATIYHIEMALPVATL